MWRPADKLNTNIVMGPTTRGRVFYRGGRPFWAAGDRGWPNIQVWPGSVRFLRPLMPGIQQMDLDSAHRVAAAMRAASVV